MTGVNRRRIWRVLRDIKYYKINTGNSVLIREKKSIKKKKKKKKMQTWDSNAYQNIIDTETLCDPRSYYHGYDCIVNFFWILNVFSIKKKTLDSPEKGVHFPDCYL